MKRLLLILSGVTFVLSLFFWLPKNNVLAWNIDADCDCLGSGATGTCTGGCTACYSEDWYGDKYCSISTSTSCSTNDDCPIGQTCITGDFYCHGEYFNCSSVSCASVSGWEGCRASQSLGSCPYNADVNCDATCVYPTLAPASPTPTPTCDSLDCYKCDPYCIKYSYTGTYPSCSCPSPNNCDLCPAATSTPTPTPTLAMPSCSGVSGGYSKDTKKLSLTYTYNCNNASPAKLNIAGYYRPPAWTAIGSSQTLSCPTVPTEKTFTSGVVADGIYDLLVGSLYSYYDLNNNNVYDSTSETRSVCTANPDWPGGATCQACKIGPVCADSVAPPVPVPSVSAAVICPSASETVTWSAVTDPSPSCGGLEYRYSVKVGGVEKASGTTSSTTFSTSATSTSGDYTVEVFSRDGTGNESLAGTVSFTVDGAAPAVPVCSTSALSPPTRFSVDWNDVADNSGGIGLMPAGAYQIDASKDSFGTICQTSYRTDSFFDITACDVAPGETASVRVRARDACGTWSGYGNCEYSRTGCSSSVTITDVARAAESYTRYNKNLSWTGVSNIDGYKIYLCNGASCSIPLAADAYFVTSVDSSTTSVVLTNSDTGFAPGTTVKVEVRPFKGTQQVADCTDYVNNFCVAPNAVVKTAPVDLTKACLRTFTFSLNDGADSGCYPHSAFFGIYNSSDTLVQNSPWVGGIDPAGTSVSWSNTTSLSDGWYYWRGRTKNSTGLYGPYDSNRFSLCIDCVAPAAPACSVTGSGSNYHFSWSTADTGCAGLGTVPYNVQREVIDILGNPILSDSSDRIPADWGYPLLFSLNSGECVKCRTSAKDAAGNSSSYGSWSGWYCYDAPTPTVVPTNTPTNTPVPTNTPTPIPGCPVVSSDLVWWDTVDPTKCRIRIGWNDMVTEDFYYVERESVRQTSVGQNVVVWTDPTLFEPNTIHNYNVNPVYGGVERSPDCPTTLITCPPLPTNTPLPTPTATCAPTDPNQPQLKSPLSPPNGQNWPENEATLEWNAVASWGISCVPGSNQRYKVYFVPNTSFPGGAYGGQTDITSITGVACNNAESLLTCDRDNLVDQETYYWQVEANNGQNHTLSAVWNFKVDQSANRWWQTKDGDVQADGNITSQIPATATSRYLSINGDGGFPGVVAWGGSGSSPSIGSGLLNWRAKTAYLGPNISFDYLANRLKIDKADSDKYFTGQMPADSGTYYSGTTDDLDLTGSFPAGKKIIIYVNGNVTVQENIVVPAISGSFFALISKGDITFANSVTSAQGFFLADGTLSTGNANVQFVGQGSFIGKGGVSMGRDLGNANSTTPGELFISRPDLFINAPSGFLFTPSFLQEIAP